MKYLQDESGNTIRLPDSLAIYKRTISFITWAIRGDFSTDFSLPNDSELRKVIGYISINQSSQVINKTMTLYNNGNMIAVGRLFVKTVGTEVDLFFISGNSNWINRIVGSIRDMDFSDFDMSVNGPAVDALKGATDGIIFPVMDWGYNFQKIGNYFRVGHAPGGIGSKFVELYPVIYQRTIFERIFEQYNLHVDGSLMDDVLFNKMAITPDQIPGEQYIAPLSSTVLMKIVDSNQDVTPGTRLVSHNEAVVASGASGSYTFDSGNSSLTSVYEFEDSQITGTIGVRNFTGITQSMVIRIFKNGVEVYSVTESFSFGGTINTKSYGPYTGPIAAGDVFQLYVTPSATLRIANSTFSLAQLNPTNYLRVNTIIPDIAQFDFIKHVAQRFNCLIDFNEFSQTVTFTKLDSITPMDAIDLSDKIVSYKQIPSSGYGALNYVRMTPAEELASLKSNNLNYGDLVIESDGDGEQDLFTTPLRPALTDVNASTDWLITHAPLFKLTDADDFIEYSAVTNSSPEARFAITGASTLFNSANVIVRIESDGALYSGYGIIRIVLTNSIELYGVDYLGADTGRIYKQTLSYPFAGSREVIVMPSTPINDFNTGSAIYGTQNIRLVDGNSNTYPYASAAYAYFAKPMIGTDLDAMKAGANYGEVINADSLSFGSLYMQTLYKIVTGRRLECSMLLTEAEFNTLRLDRYYYLRTKDFSGYFLITDSSGYVDSITPVTFNLVLVR